MRYEKILNTLIAVTLFGVGVIHSSSAQSDVDKFISSDPRQLTSVYLKHDFDGDLLSSETYKTSGLLNFIVPGEFESGGSETIILIKGYRITNASQENTKALITVEYDVIGLVTLDVSMEKKESRYTFRCKKQDGRWMMIDPYNLSPHVSIDSAVSHYERLDKIQGGIGTSTNTVLTKLKELRSSLTKSSTVP